MGNELDWIAELVGTKLSVGLCWNLAVKDLADVSDRVFRGPRHGAGRDVRRLAGPHGGRGPARRAGRRRLVAQLQRPAAHLRHRRHRHRHLFHLLRHRLPRHRPRNQRKSPLTRLLQLFSIRPL